VNFYLNIKIKRAKIRKKDEKINNTIKISYIIVFFAMIGRITWNIINYSLELNYYS